MLRLLLAALHLLGLGIGLGAGWVRARALSGPLDANSLRRAFAADTWWAVAAGVWITTGLWRLIAGTEKATGYYMQNHFFFAKMGMLALILLLEIMPIVTLVKWRRIVARNEIQPEALTGPARRLATISYVQAALVAIMVLAAVSMARGYGAF